MKLISTIAKNELRQLFFSSTAWFVTFVFLLLCAFFYTGIMFPVAKNFYDVRSVMSPLQVAMADLTNLKLSLTEILFTNPQSGFFPALLPYTYLFFPLLTMGVINREFDTGTSQLLGSSPISIRQIILGKYLAYSLYNLLLVSIIGLFVALGAMHVKYIDIIQLLCGLGGFFLLFSTYTAIGFFASSLSRYQLAAGVGTFLILAVLTRIGTVWQQYELMRQVSWFLSLQNRIEYLLRGLVRTKDVIYYGIMIVLFLRFTMLRMDSEQGKLPGYVYLFQYLCHIALAIVVGITTSLPGLVGYWDCTGNHALTIDPRLQALIRKLDKGPLQINVYANIFDSDGFAVVAPSKRNQLREAFETISRFKANIEVNYVYYYHYRSPHDSISLQRTFPGKTAREVAELLSPIFHVRISDLLSPEQIDRRIDASAEHYQLFVQARYGSNVASLRAFPKSPLSANIPIEDDSQPHFYAAFRRLLGEKMPRISFVSGNLERNIFKNGQREFQSFVNDPRNYFSLINLGFDVDTLNLRIEDPGADIAALVIADPKISLDSLSLRKLKMYISRGGNMVVLGEPGKQYVVNPVLSSVGVRLMDGQLVEKHEHMAPDVIGVNLTLNDTVLSKEPMYLQCRELYVHGYPFNAEVGHIQGAVAVATDWKDSLFVARPLFTTIGDRAWNQAGKLVVDSTLPAFDPDLGDVKESPFTIVAGLTRTINGSEQRIVVSGDADIMSNGSSLYGGYARSFFSWLSYGRYPLYTESAVSGDHSLFLRSNTFNSTERAICLFLFPGFLALTGMVLLIRRNRK